MDNKNIVKNIGLSMIMKPISMVLSLIYTPIALSFLGDAKYGVWAIILNIVTWIGIFDIGIGNGLRNRLAESYTKGNTNDAQSYVSTAYIGTLILSIVFFIVINCIWNVFNLSDIFQLDVYGENVNHIIMISTFFICINFVLSLSKTSAYAIQKSGAISVASAIGQVIQIIVLCCMSKFLNQSLMAVAIMYGVASLAENIILYCYVTNKNQFLVPKISYVKSCYMKSLITLGIGFFAMQICSVVLNTTDNLLISSLYGSSAVTPYSIVYKFFYLFPTVHSIILMPMWSAYTEAATRKDIQWIKNTIKKINWITVAFSVFVFVSIFLFEPFSKLWLGKNLNYGRHLIFLVALYMIAQMIFNSYNSFLCGVGYIKSSTIVAVIETVLNIPLSIWFAKDCDMGLSGIIMGSFCVMLLGTISTPIATYRWIKSVENDTN